MKRKRTVGVLADDMKADYNTGKP